MRDGEREGGRIVGYARISTTEQKMDMQEDALSSIGAEVIFRDQASGARDDRPGLTACLASLREGDTLAVWKLDRLGRSLPHLVQVVAELRERGVHLRSITESIDTSTAHGRLLFGLFGTLAEFERDLIRERIAAGRKAAVARGTRFGPRPKMTESKVDLARREMAAGRGIKEVARDLGVSRSTLYAAIAAAEEAAAREAAIPHERRSKGRPRKAA
jgi:DNA invertase Pin-like site-specific DNA recombinase